MSGRLVLGDPGPEFRVAPVVHGPAEVPEGAGGNDGCHLGDEGVVLPLAGVEGLADVLPAGPEEPVAAAKPVGPDGQVVAEPVDVDGPAAVFLLPDGQADGTFAPALSQPSGQEFLCLDLRSGGLLDDWPWCSHLNVRVGDSRRRPKGGDGAPPRGRRPTVVEVQT